MAEGFDPKRCVQEVPEELLCAICFNVLKKAVSCGENEHYFCKSCINQHLERSKACPLCNEKLTKNTLVKPSKLLKSMLSRLEVRCEYFDRGCQEVVSFEFIDNHVEICDYSPVKCTNHNCKEEVSKRDLTHHEQVVCQYRQSKCHDCTRMVEEMKNLNASMSEQNKRMNDALDANAQNQRQIRNELGENQEIMKAELDMNQAEVNARLDEVFGNQEGMKAELDRITQNQAEFCQTQHEFSRQLEEINSQLQKMIKLTGNICPECTITELEPKIIIMGGSFGDGKTVEMFNCADMKWTRMQPMKEERSSAVSFMYNKQLFVCGGVNTTSNIGTLKTDVADILIEKWVDSPIQLPNMLFDHCAEVYNDTLFLIGGHDGWKVCSSIWEVQLQPPYDQQLLLEMPEPRYFHRSVIIGDKIYIFGGCEKLHNFLNSVLMYDITANYVQHVSRLPYPVAHMTVVKYKENIIVIGGCNNSEKALNEVFVFNTRSGKSDFLPSMITARRGCAAVVINNEIFVMGGRDDKSNYLNTVEVFNFDLFCWRELPAMNERRAFHTAIVI